MSSNHTGEEAVAVAVESCPDDARVDAVGRHIGAHFLIKPDHAPEKESELSDASTVPKTCIAWMQNEEACTDLKPCGELSGVKHIGELRNRVRLRRVVRSLFFV
jgi:hypothetical protein